MANRRHVDSSRIPVRTKRRTSKVAGSPPSDAHDGADETAASRPRAVVDGDFDTARHAADAVARSDADSADDADFEAGSAADEDPAGTAEDETDGALDVLDDGEDADFDGIADTSSAAERLAVAGDIDDDLSEELGVDNIVGPLEAGLGGGLDQAEEARAGITDEEIASRTRRR